MMTKLLLAAVAAVSLTACLDEATPLGIETAGGRLPSSDEMVDDVLPASDGLAAEARTLCSLVVQDDADSPCAHLCDPDFAETYIPQHSCATFACTLADGSEYRTGGCNL